MHKGIIFNLDGVICHTGKYHYQAWKSIADELSIYFGEDINNRLRDVSQMESFEIILEKYDGKMTEEEKKKWVSKKNEIYEKLLSRMKPADVSAEVKETLDCLRKRGFQLGIGSSGKKAGFILERLGLMECFDAVSDGNNITKSKPDPEVFLKAAEYLGLSPGECLVVEDAVAGLEAAKAGGMDCAAIGDAGRSELAVYKLHTFSDLLEAAGECG